MMYVNDCKCQCTCKCIRAIGNNPTASSSNRNNDYVMISIYVSIYVFLKKKQSLITSCTGSEWPTSPPIHAYKYNVMPRLPPQPPPAPSA